MQTIALHTRVTAGHEADYDREHAVIPADLDPALREAGVRGWRIWRDGQDLFHLVEVEDYARMRDHLRDHPANRRWQQHINRFLEVADDYSGGDEGLTMVWQLPEETPR